MNISIVIGNMALDAELNDGPTARRVAQPPGGKNLTKLDVSAILISNHIS